jgi:proteic killer suppression protein
MILTIRHKGLELYFKTGRMSGIQTIHAKRLRELLTALKMRRKARLT